MKGIRSLLAHALALAALGCGGTAPPSMVLIMVDTLRADTLGCYGSGKETSPCIDRLSARGARFALAPGSALFKRAPEGLAIEGSRVTVADGASAGEGFAVDQGPVGAGKVFDHHDLCSDEEL